MRFEPQPVTGQQRHGDSNFPLVLTADGSVSQQDLHAQSAALIEQLATHGAILFRGCGVTDAQAFDDFVAGFVLPNFPYDQSLSNAVRNNRTPRVFPPTRRRRMSRFFCTTRWRRPRIFRVICFSSVSRPLCRVAPRRSAAQICYSRN